MGEDKNTERDDFWNLEKLLPKKRASLGVFASSTTLSDYSPTAQSETAKDAREEKRLTLDRSGETAYCECREYCPTDSLIKRVRIKFTADKYDFYEGFRNSALIYFDYKTKKCDFAQFYSYMPQYSQMTRAQKDYYFYWRDEFRSGRYIKTDYSYVYLFVYEVLNLPDKIPPEEGILLLTRLWRNYRRDLPRLDMYFSIWVMDYCLVHGIPCPRDEISDFLYSVISVSSFKEFYLYCDSGASSVGTSSMLALLSDYDWRLGRYADGSFSAEADRIKYRELYKLHLEGAMHLILRKVLEEYLSSNSAECKTVTRAAFPNSLCTHKVKCRLEIDYLPLGEFTSLRLGITGAVRYTENKLRALFGAKSRILVKHLPDEYKKLIDLYFEGLNVGRDGECRKLPQKPEYERLYDAPRGELSFEGADEIERLSWETTARLVTEEDSIEYDAPITSQAPQEPFVEEDDPEIQSVEQKTDACPGELFGLSPREVKFLSDLVFGGEYPSDSLAADAIAERINEAFADGFGDVVLENDGEKYCIIEDYIEDVKDLLWKTKK